jgi:hypothetical protein
MTRGLSRLALVLCLAILAGLGGWFASRGAAPPEAGPLTPREDASTEARSGLEAIALEGRAVSAARTPLPRGAGVIVGTVHRDGAPVAARISIRVAHPPAFDPWLGKAHPFAYMSELPPPPDAAGETVLAGAEGRFTVADVGVGTFHLLAVTDDGATGTTRAIVTADGARVEVAIPVTDGPLSLHGRAVWADGRAFAGTVIVSPNAEEGFGAAFAPGTRIVSPDADGRFVATRLPVGTVAVTALLEGRLVVPAAPVLLPHSGEYLLTVDAELVKWAGRVVGDDDGTAVEGAEVTSMGVGPGRQVVLCRATTDTGGGFDVLLPPGRAARLFARAQGFAPLVVSVRSVLSAQPLELRLHRGGTVTGRVTRDTDGAPVAGLTVTVSPVPRRGEDLPARAPPAMTDADGRYSVSGVSPGEAMVVATGAGYVTPGEHASGTGYNPQLVTVASGETEILDFLVTRGARVEGLVLDASGTSVAGAVVRLGAATAASGRDGRFVLEGVGAEHRISASRPGFVTATVDLVTPVAGTTTTVEIRFAAPRYVDVTVLDGVTGTPITGARLRASGPSSPVVQEFATAADGRARVGPLLAEEHEVTVRASGYVQASLHLTASDTTVLVRLEPGLEVAGRVSWPDGTPAAGAQVHGSTPGSNDSESTTCAPDGSFVLRGLRPGPVALAASVFRDEAMHSAQVSASAGARDVVLRLVRSEGPGSAPSRLVARVLDPQGRPVSRAFGRLRTGTGASGSQVRDGRAEWNVEIPAGTKASLEIWGASGADGASLPLGRTTVPVAAGAGDVEVRLPPEVSVSGIVRTSDGTPIRGVLVTAAPAGDAEALVHIWEGLPRAWTDGGGAFRVGGLNAEAYDLRFDTGWAHVPPEPVRVLGGDRDVDVRVKPGLSVAVTVHDPDGRPVPGVSVVARRAGGTPGSPAGRRFHGDNGTTGRDGVARLRRLDPEATWALDVSGSGDDLGRVTIDPWIPRDGTVVLPRTFSVEGVVHDVAGRPVPGVLVMQEVGVNGETGHRTDGEGRFRITGLAGDDVVLRAALPGHARDRAAGSGGVRVPAGATDVVLILDVGLEIVVRVDNPERFPMAQVVARLLVQREGRTLTLDVAGSASAPFRFRGLRPGDDCTFWIAAQGGSDHAIHVPGLKPGADVLARARPGRSITGRLEVPAGATSLGLGAEHAGLRAWGQVNEDGTFEIRGLPEGTTWVVRGVARSADASTFYMGEVTAKAGDEIQMELK